MADASPGNKKGGKKARKGKGAAGRRARKGARKGKK